MENELYHHGVKGQKWGFRRYQNKDGSLTLAGKKRALKIQDQYTRFSNNKKYRDKEGNLTYAGRKKALKMKEKYSELTGGKQLRKFQTVNKNNYRKVPTKPKQKSLSEMSDEEIQAKIDRINLENKLKSLTPEKMTAGQKFANGLKDAAISIAKDKGTKIVGDYIDKQLRDILGLSDNQSKTASDILKERAQDMENRKKIAEAEDYLAKRAKSQEQRISATEQTKQSNSSKPTESNKTKELASKVVNKADQMYKDSVSSKSAKIAVSNSKNKITQYNLDSAREKEKVSNALDQIYERRKANGKMTPEYYKIMQRHMEQSTSSINNKYDKKIADYIENTISDSKNKSYESQKNSIKEYNKNTNMSQRRSDSMYYSDMVKALEEYKRKQKN